MRIRDVLNRDVLNRATNCRYVIPAATVMRAGPGLAGPAETAAPPGSTTTPESTTTPGASSVGREPGAARSVRTEADHEIDDHFRHIVCVLCNPAFEGTRQAPHDTVCICGKRLRKGDAPGPATAPQCILCNELVEHHFSVAHADED